MKYYVNIYKVAFSVKIFAFKLLPRTNGSFLVICSHKHFTYMRNGIFLILACILSALAAVFIYQQIAPPVERVVYQTVQPTLAKIEHQNEPGIPTNYVSSAPTNFIDAAKKVTSSVVNIRAIEESSYNFWGSGADGGSTGSGVIISDDGHIVTNNHVISDGDRLEVTLHDKRKFDAKVVGSDSSTDLALIKIEGVDMPHLVFGNSDSVQIGEWVLAVGNPFNLASTVTAGIVSAKGRSINILDDQYSIESFIQTDAAVNPGNSGGALVNTKGDLVGINTAIMTRSGRYEGYSFAIPANLARKIVSDLKEYGIVQRGILGVEIRNVDQEISEELGLGVLHGILISRVNSMSGAEEAGLESGDVIIEINKIAVQSIPELQEQVARFRPGNKINIGYIRDGKKAQTDVVLKTKANSTAILSSNDYDYLEEIGFEVRDLTRKEIRSFSARGAKVISIVNNSIISNTNMDPGFIITEVNGQMINNVEQLLRLIVEAEERIVMKGFYENYPDQYVYAFVK